MHTFQRTNDGWEVGYYQPTEDSEINQVHYWIVLATFTRVEHAILAVSGLNGGEIDWGEEIWDRFK